MKADRMPEVREIRTPPIRPNAFFTLIELLVVITIISILAAMMLPVLQKAIGEARRMRCISNLKQLYLVSMNYIDDNRNWLPYPHAYWAWKMKKYVNNKTGNDTIFYCPAAISIPRNKYSMSNNAYTASFPWWYTKPQYSRQFRKIKKKYEVPWLKDGEVHVNWGYCAPNSNCPGYPRHLGTYNCLYWNGVVRREWP